MPFFIRNKKSANKRKRNVAEAEVKEKKPKIIRKSKDEEIQSDSDAESDFEDVRLSELPVESDSEDETAQEKRIRLAKQYISQLENEEADKISDEEEVDKSVSQRLKKEFLEQKGRLQKDIANKYLQPTADDIHLYLGHQLTVTCLAITSDDHYVFSAGKDCSIIKWDIVNQKKLKTIHGGRKGTEESHIGHTDQIMSIAISTDNKYMATGDKNKLIYVWDVDTCNRLKVLTGHRDTVSGLAFRKGSHQLFSTSHDRTVKIWSLDEMAYIETLFGHNDIVTGIDSLTRERAITSGGRDGSIRVWKVIEESQLVFHGHSGSIDCVALINEEHFVSGSDDNSLCLWSILKKKPLCTVNNAHPGTNSHGKSGSNTNTEHWITCVTSLQTTDFIASGSHDGCARLWQSGAGFKSLQLLYSINLLGFINCLKFSSNGLKLVAAVGKEHRLGRWWNIKSAKNSVQVISLNRLDSKANSDS